jgi:hypothetical protein
MASSGILRRVALVRTTFWKIFLILMMETLRSSETSVLTKVTQRDIQEDDIHHSHRR